MELERPILLESMMDRHLLMDTGRPCPQSGLSQVETLSVSTWADEVGASEIQPEVVRLL
jgi:hypothetical protein